MWVNTSKTENKDNNSIKKYLKPTIENPGLQCVTLIETQHHPILLHHIPAMHVSYNLNLGPNSTPQK